ncbi:MULTISPECIES: heat-inducible transcriptional repressor HrcA [Dyella]|uniref:heat-inducible transcriptional repressor HrcA n=1 Tax=Dyella TaxID=231454 RepID=UPI000C81CD3D|nr:MULTISPECIES: heat-inducible transcriptional repressor HrcA [Dyella]MDR3446913.1 heat-inducible transcriptional repressor HrcA [Dyella sp.]PMQ04137.1 Heat-inducible transcription repressor HrcA [Dyella sp. AD56]ULU23206.1 heat-inducible transcriptional repressor HrcA [Dyella terrae]
MPAAQLDARARRLLRTLIAQYLADGEPVGSRTLSRSSGLDVSPATIRNIMSDLEEAGLVASPHTSAGRVPTPRGLRLFVDSLIELQPLPQDEMARLRRELPPGLTTTRDLLGNVSTLLSAMTQFAGVVTVPRQADFPLRHIDFVALPDARVLVILVFSDNQVQNRIVQLAKPLDGSELEQAANYLNAQFAGLRLDDIRAHLLRELREASGELNRLMSSAVELAAASFAPQGDSDDVLVSGQTNLMGYSELANLERLRELFEAFQKKSELLQLMEVCAKAPGVRLFIGEESGFAALDGCSVVTASYGTQGRVLGAIGVIGPTRMAYERVIPVVQATAGLLSDALNRVATTL